MHYDIAVIGGGAAGFFAAIHAAENSNKKVVIFEKTAKILSKVAISGGGRCNVAHDCYKPGELVKNFPRGGKKLYKSFEQFSTEDTLNWFRERGISFKTEEDGRIFPVSDDSSTITSALIEAAQNAGVDIFTKKEINLIDFSDSEYHLGSKDGDNYTSSKVIITPGGHSKDKFYQWLESLGLKIEKPIPSLFTFNVPDSGLTDLQGVSVPYGKVKITGSRQQQDGPILITHWGFSGPAVIKLSAWAAKELHECNYHFDFLLNWCGLEDTALNQEITGLKENHPHKKVSSLPIKSIPRRLWQRLCQKAGINEEDRFTDLKGKKLNRLIEHLLRDPYKAQGKTTYKEEFVTAGGVSLNEVNLKTFESKKFSGLYLAGEVLDVDGVTGGFNFQHAWTSGYLAGINAAK